jgi:NitT/TauT family transport system permease protein
MRGVQAVRILLTALFFGCWETAARWGYLDPFFFGKPSAIMEDLFHLVVSGEVFFHAWITLQEALIGFFLGAALGIGMAFALAASPFWAKVLDPFIFLLYGIPRIALAPLFILWFGLGIASKVVFAFALVFFLVFFNTFAGIKGVDKDMVNAVKVMGASRGQLLYKVILPSISPWVLAGLKSGVGMSLLGAIVGEYVGGNAGLGWMINAAAGLFETTRVFSALVALGILVLLINEVINRLERRLLRWRPQIKVLQ